MENKKYELLENDKITINGHTLYRIRALKNLETRYEILVHKGDIGGYIENESNLGFTGTAWVYDESKVYGGVVVKGHAAVHGNSDISGTVELDDNAWLCDSYFA